MRGDVGIALYEHCFYSFLTRSSAPVWVRFFFRLLGADGAVGDHGAGVSAGLGVEIVGVPVDHGGAAQDLSQAETAGHHGQIRPAAAGQQGRQVSGMAGMGAARRVIVAPGGAFVDMEGEKACVGIRKSPDPDLYEDAAWGLPEPRQPPQSRMRPVPPDPCHGIGPPVWCTHKITSRKTMREVMIIFVRTRGTFRV